MANCHARQVRPDLAGALGTGPLRYLGSRRTRRRIFVATTAAITFSGTPCLAQKDAIARAVDSIATEVLSQWSVPGMSVIVLRGSTTIVAKGFGFANRETHVPATAATIYQLGSISKQFTAAGIMRLVERRLVQLDDPVSRHLPEYRPVGDSVRVRHLLHQTSGIREEFTISEYGQLIGDTTRKTGELIALIEREPLGFRPGSRWSYSNSNYALLAEIITRITGKPYDQFLAEEFFRPLGLTTFRHCDPLPTSAIDARGYMLDSNRVVPSPAENMEWIRGDGGLCSSAEDLARWARALATGRAVIPASYRQMATSTRLTGGITPAYGFGLSLVPLDGTHRRVSHGGRMAGFTGTLAYYPDRDVTIAVLANRSGLWIESVEQAIARTVLRVPRRPIVRPSPMAADQRRRYLGSYDIGISGMVVRIAERGDDLWIEWPPPGPTSKLLYQGGRAFAAELQPDAIGVTFASPDRAGRPTRVVILMAGMHWYGRRVQEESGHR